MDQRGFDAMRPAIDDEESSRLHVPVRARLGRARVLIECTRAALHACKEPDLLATLCRQLVQPGGYSEACLIIAKDASSESAHRASEGATGGSFYAGIDKQALEDPDRFWSASGREDAVKKLLAGETAVRHEAASGALMLQLRSDGRIIGVLAVCASNHRVPDDDELEPLQSLADDVACAILRIRENSPQRTLVARERRLRETVEHAGVGITRIDMNGVFIEVNQKFCDMLGYAREELVGRAARDVTVPEDSGPGAVFRMKAQLGRASVLSGEKRYRRKDGTHIWVRRTMSPAFDESGRMRDAISIVEDITERKEAEEAAHRERTLLRTIIDAVPDFIYVKDEQGRFQVANAAWLQARRLASDDLRGKSALDFFPESVARRMEEEDLRVMESGQPLFEDVQSASRLDERGNPVQRWSSTTKVPMRSVEGKIIGIVGISHDITQRRRMEGERAMEHIVARILSESRSVSRTMPILIQTICEALGWTYGAYWFWDKAASALRRSAWWCEFEPQFEASDASIWVEVPTPRPGGLIGEAWLEQSATWVRDIEQEQDFRRESSCRKLGFRSAFAFPIAAEDEPLGLMEFFGRETREPDQTLLEVSGAISSQIGQYIRRKQAEESLQESEQQLRAVFEHADVGIAMTSLDMSYLRVNDKFCGIVGYQREELLRMRTSDVNLEANFGTMRADRSRLVKEEQVGSTTAEKQLVRKDGSLVWVSISTSLVRASDGSPRYFIAIVQDISEHRRAAYALKESEEQFRVLAHYDTLTALPNRLLFYDRLANALAHARRNTWFLAVLFIDLDRFKNVNDTFGHAAGDQLLKQVSQRLVKCVRSEDTAGRLSGDEFAIVLSHLTAPEDAGTVAKKILGELNRTFQLEGADLFVTVSIGITIFPTDSTEQEALIRNADVAMYRAKDRGRNGYQFYTSGMNRRTREMLNMEGELRRAVERDELVLYYQPKVSLVTAEITGVEALLRWQHPERGLIPPGDFIPLLEDTGLIVQAGEWVLDAVCRQLTDWRTRRVCLVPIAVNLSARQFLAPDLGERVKAVIEKSGVGPEFLQVEITESAIMTDAEEASRTLEYLQSLGVSAAIDDFGTGYSSLAYLKRFPLCALKVDRSFIRDITTNPDDEHITQAVISMAHSLRLKVIAEGVETEAQLAFLLRYGCDEVQGYLFSKPVPPEACVIAFVDRERVAKIIESARNQVT